MTETVAPRGDSPSLRWDELGPRQRQFTYFAPAAPAPPVARTPTCTVPRLKGRTLQASRKVLRRNQCRLGKVRGRGKGKTRVGRQNPKPGTVRPTGAAVNVRLR